MADITVVIPVRNGGSPTITLRSLERQTYRDFSLVISPDPEQRGACWARNRGLERADTPLILFSDDDIVWEPGALQILRQTLLTHPEASYSYGSYLIGTRPVGNLPFDAWMLKRRNYISTMSLIRRDHMVSWDESVVRLQDWDLWLTMLRAGRVGVYCGQRIFRTVRRENGITYGTISWGEAVRRLQEKHGI